MVEVLLSHDGRSRGKRREVVLRLPLPVTCKEGEEIRIQPGRRRAAARLAARPERLGWEPDSAPGTISAGSGEKRRPQRAYVGLKARHEG